MKKSVRILAHVVFVLALASITLMILNVYNPLMGFTSSNYAQAVFLALGVLSALLAALVFCRGREEKKSGEDASSPPDPE